MKDKFHQYLRTLSPDLQGAVYSLALRLRNWLRKAQSVIPYCILRHLPGRSKFFGPPRNMVVSITPSDMGVLNISSGFKSVVPEKLPVPEGLPTTVSSIYENVSEVSSRDVSLYRYSESRTYSNQACIITKNDEFVVPLSWEILRCTSESTAKNHSIFTKWKLPKVVKKKQTVLVMQSPSGQVYYHWLFDVLPKLAVMHEAGMKIDDYDVLGGDIKSGGGTEREGGLGKCE